MSSTSSPPDASNVVHGVFPTQALRVGDGRRLTPERTTEEATRSVEEAGAAAAENSSGERGTPGPPAEEAQTCFAFIAGDDKDGSSEQSQAPFHPFHRPLDMSQACASELEKSSGSSWYLRYPGRARTNPQRRCLIKSSHPRGRQSRKVQPMLVVSIQSIMV